MNECAGCCVGLPLTPPMSELGEISRARGYSACEDKDNMTVSVCSIAVREKTRFIDEATPTL